MAAVRKVLVYLALHGVAPGIVLIVTALSCLSVAIATPANAKAPISAAQSQVKGSGAPATKRRKKLAKPSARSARKRTAGSASKASDQKAARQGSVGGTKKSKNATKARKKKSVKSGVDRGQRSKRPAKKRKTRRSRQASKQVAKKRRVIIPARPSIGQAFGLHATTDPLALRSSVALVMNQRNKDVLLSKNSSAVLPIASITKLMTAMVTIDAQLPGAQMIALTGQDADRRLNTKSRLAVGTRLSRDELLQLALMSSENRAANALGRSYPGGMDAFVSAMNAKSKLLGMFDTSFVDPAGLSSGNVSTATDLARLVSNAFNYARIREYSTASQLSVDTGYRVLSFRNTNSLIGANDKWQISVQKTGYISEAGRCLVMQTRIEGMPVVIVLLDSEGSQSRFGDARRIRRWLLAQSHKSDDGSAMKNVSSSSLLPVNAGLAAANSSSRN